MRHSIHPVLARLAALAVASVAAAACTSEKITYKSPEEASTNPPPAAAANFLGYTDTLTKQTVCGTCHLDKQAAWAQTHHANAWADLQASGHATASCNPCHTVSSLGNAVTDTLVAFLATKDLRYKDVQCESCHGPGAAHAAAPGLGNQPLASINVDTGTAIGNGCGECHTGANNPFVDEWARSAHGHSVESHAAGNAACLGCHSGQGALVAWGVNTNYVEVGQQLTDPMNITCAVCHDPHGGPNVAQLRLPITATDTTQNLCMRCHQRNSGATPSNTRGPHSPEGPTLLGFAGWFPPSYTGPDTITLTHGTVAANPGLCVTCHMNPMRVTNASGALVSNYSGHLFLAIPCLDANGVPTTGDCSMSQRSFSACAASGCHATPSVASSLMSTAQARLALLDSALNSQLVQIAASQFAAGTVVTTAQGAKFNLLLAEEPGSVVHNPFLMEALLTASIKQVQLDYKVSPKITVNLTNILRGEVSDHR